MKYVFFVIQKDPKICVVIPVSLSQLPSDMDVLRSRQPFKRNLVGCKAKEKISYSNELRTVVKK